MVRRSTVSARTLRSALKGWRCLAVSAKVWQSLRMHKRGFSAPLVGIMAAGCLSMVAVPVIYADANACTNTISTNHVSTVSASTNVLWLWIDAPTNATRTNLFGLSEITATNCWLPPGKANILSTSSTWRTTATVETGFFRAEGPGWPGYNRRCEDGWFQEVGVEMDRAIDHGESGVSVGVGVSVGRAAFRGP